MASIAGHLMRQDIGYRKFTGVDRTGSPGYDPPLASAPAVVKGRLALAETMLVDEDGKQLNNIARLYTQAAVGVGDLISLNHREWSVVKVVERLNLKGQRDHVEAYMK